MESLIANLLRAFEQGRMNRRELVQSLALAARGVEASGADSARGVTRAEEATTTATMCWIPMAGISRSASRPMPQLGAW